jgi:hypothetical protein
VLYCDRQLFQRVGEKGYLLQETSLKIIVIRIKRSGDNTEIFVAILCVFCSQEFFLYGFNMLGTVVTLSLTLRTVGRVQLFRTKCNIVQRLNYLVLFHNELNPKLAVREYIQKFPDWPPGARTASGTDLCH